MKLRVALLAADPPDNTATQPMPYSRTEFRSARCLNCEKYSDENSFKLPSGVVLQHPWRPTFGYRRRSRAYPGSDRLLGDCGCRPQGRPLRFLRNRLRDGLCRRPAGHDLCRDGGDCCRHDLARQGPRSSVSLCRHHPDGHHPDRCGMAEAGPRDALRFPFCHHRLRQCACDPDLHGPVTRTRWGPDAHLHDDCRRSCHHLPLSIRDQGDPIAACGHRGSHGHGVVVRHGPAHRR